MKTMTEKTMNLSLKAIGVAILALIGIGLIRSAHAATPVAVWDGDFKTTVKGNYTLDANGNTVAADGSTITIASKGVKVSFSEMSAGVTVMYKYSDLSTGKEQALATVKSGSYGNVVGVELTTNNKTKGIWQGSSWSTEDSSFTASSGKFAMTYKHDGGTYAYSVANGSRTQIYGRSDLKSSNYKPEGVNVGGMDSSLGATGMKISAIAVFNSVLSEDDMKNYAFPSDMPYSSVISINLGTTGRNGEENWPVSAGTDPGGVYADSNWYNVPNPSTDNLTVGRALLSCKAKNNWSNSGQDKAYNKGYLDDGTETGITGPSVTISCLKNGCYNLVIYCSSDNANRFSYKTVNGKNYTYDSTTGAAKEGTASWGSNGTGTTEPGNHALLIKNLQVTDGTIAISSIRKDENEEDAYVRGCISAIQISEAPCEATVTGNAAWSELAWSPSNPSAGSAVKLIRGGDAAGATVTIDESIILAKVSVVSDSGKELTLALGGGKAFAATSYDFAGANGKVTVGFSTGTAAVTAGKDTVVPSSGTGVLTIGDNKKATVLDGSWSGTKTLSSSGEICYGGTMPSTLPYTAANPTGNGIVGYAGTYTESGDKLEFKNNLTTRRIEAGANIKASVLQLGNSDNAVETFEQMGGVIEATSNGAGTETGSAAIIIAHYGWNAPSQVTYNLLGGSMVATNATQYGVYFGADGKATMTIGNGSSEAVLDTTGIAQGNQTRTQASALTIAENGMLKLGTGGLKFLNSNASVTLSGGTVYAKENCSLSVAKSDGFVLAASKDSKLSAVNGKTLTVSSKVSGSGSLTKTGTGSVVLSGANTYSGGTEIISGVLALGSASALGSGTVTIGEDGELDLNGWSVTATFAGNGTICNSSTTPASVNGVRVTQGKSVSLSDGKINIHLDADETLTLTSIPNGTVTIGGSGRVEYTNATIPELPAGLWAEDWTGTFAYSGCDTNKTDWDPTSYYNGTKSKFEFGGKITYNNGTSQKSYFRATEFSLGELILKSGSSIGFNDGYTTPSKEEKTVNNYCFTKLSGSGTLTIDSTTTASPGIKFGDVSEFAGTISNTSSSDSGYRIILGEGELKAVGDDPTKAAIHLTGNTTLNTITLSAKSGVKITDDAVVTVVEGKTPQCSSGVMALADGSSLVFKDKDSRLWANGGISVDSSASIPLKVVNSAGLNKNTYLITWTTSAQPAGTFALDLGTSRAKGEHGLSAEKTTTGLKLNEVATETYYEVAGGVTTTFDNAWLETAGVKGDTTEATQTALNGTNANGIKMSDVYLMGYAAAEAQNAAVILTPNQALSNGETISLSVAGVPAETRNGAVVTYKALASANRDWANPTVEETMDTLSVDMALPTSGVLYYRVQAAVALP